MHNPLLTSMLHEDSLLAVHREVSMLLYPCRDQHLPLASYLLSTIHTLHQLQCISVWDMLRPPIGWADVYLLLSYIPIKEHLLRVRLEQVESESMLRSDCYKLSHLGCLQHQSIQLSKLVTPSFC